MPKGKKKRLQKKLFIPVHIQHTALEMTNDFVTCCIPYKQMDPIESKVKTPGSCICICIFVTKGRR